MNRTLEGAVEANVLCALVWHPKACHAVAMRVPIELFSTREYQEIAKQALAYIEQYHKPAGAHIHDMLEYMLRRGTAEANIIRFALDQMEKLRHDLNPDYVLRELDQFVQLRRFAIAVEDACDAIQAGDLKRTAELFAEAHERYQGSVAADELSDAAVLLKTRLPDLNWIVPCYVPAGLTMVVGPPKSSKTWMVLNVATASATGGEIFGECVEPTGVLLLSFEDNPRRLKSRLKAILRRTPLPRGSLRYEFTPRGTGAAFVAWLKRELEQHPDIGLVIIDTLQHIRSAQRSGQQIYEYDVATMGLLNRLVSERGISIIVVHHTRKARGDQLEMVSGSHGLTGSADTIITLTRHDSERAGNQEGDTEEQAMQARDRTKHCRMRGTGRDLVEEFDKLIEFDGAIWRVVDDYHEATPEKRERTQDRILDVMHQIGGPVQADTIADRIGKTRNVVDVALSRMRGKGLVINPDRGFWMLRDGRNLRRVGSSPRRIPAGGVSGERM